MPLLCAVSGCNNKSTNKGLSFYRFPKTKKNAASDINALITQQRESWYSAINIVDNMIDSKRICSVHFKTGKPAKYDDIKNPDWKPSLKIGYNNSGKPAKYVNIKNTDRKPSLKIGDNNSEKVTIPTVQRYQQDNIRLELKPAQLFQASSNTPNIIIISS